MLSVSRELPMRNFLTLLDWSAEELQQLLTEAERLKANPREPVLAGRVLGLVFEKPSLRTRASFEAAMAQAGGGSIFLSAADGPLGQRESVPDFARTLSQYVDAVVLRTFRHQTVERSEEHTSELQSRQYLVCRLLLEKKKK